MTKRVFKLSWREALAVVAVVAVIVLVMFDRVDAPFAFAAGIAIGGGIVKWRWSHSSVK